jgi:hypothetical protein
MLPNNGDGDGVNIMYSVLYRGSVVYDRGMDLRVLIGVVMDGEGMGFYNVLVKL